VLAIAGVALAGAAKPVPTKVTIVPPNSKTTTLHGKVYSADKSCWTRTIQVHQIQGPAQNPTKDKVVATTTSKAGHGNGFWKLTSDPHPGRYYARATKAPGCKPGSSKLLHLTQ
jgi:hypothetical protein